MKVRAKLESLKDKKPSDFVKRFSFGGAITGLVHIIAHYVGPVVAGLFLAFPAILPATLTLISQHDGRVAASKDALGAIVGAVGLLGFAMVLWALVGVVAFSISLFAAIFTWLGISCTLWRVVLSRREHVAG